MKTLRLKASYLIAIPDEHPVIEEINKLAGLPEEEMKELAKEQASKQFGFAGFFVKEADVKMEFV